MPATFVGFPHVAFSLRKLASMLQTVPRHWRPVYRLEDTDGVGFYRSDLRYDVGCYDGREDEKRWGPRKPWVLEYDWYGAPHEWHRPSPDMVGAEPDESWRFGNTSLRGVLRWFGSRDMPYILAAGFRVVRLYVPAYVWQHRDQVAFTVDRPHSARMVLASR